ncbi:hypothetical protein LMH87_006775 [Akanthomyces muscarius]|uniref:Uncharacterized protein n=1 Tax=Akanthomyces muscarius TaxID=2231603 RepID=A0A9W8UTH8_AKAMU|nr:hypothetical protein LMH87_006775 [Akanthomyces muscarius]KAJ4165129.1 hypothetical protein LMH87_006775 [Akanthomyces muscarius]
MLIWVKIDVHVEVDESRTTDANYSFLFYQHVHYPYHRDPCQLHTPYPSGGKTHAGTVIPNSAYTKRQRRLQCNSQKKQQF